MLIAAFIMILSMAFSYTIIGVINPFRGLSGLLCILSDKSPYTVISEDPKIVLSQPDELTFIDYMDGLGFAEIEERRLGSIRVFTNGEAEERVVYRQNRFLFTMEMGENI